MRPSEFTPKVKKALDLALAEHLILTQGKLAKDNPKDTGRMASSWFIGKNTPSNEVAPERGGPRREKGETGPTYNRNAPVQIPDYGGPIEYDGTWYITNNLPYAERVGLDPRWAKGGAGGADWYTRIVNQQPRDFNKRADKYLRRIR
jgi:hypothetical protein